MADPSRFEGIPEIIYGTAFKFEKSASLVEAALNAGFRAVDTAGSKSAYREALVGEGIAAALSTGAFKRKELYIQTKFSPHKRGKDPASYPYDTSKSIPDQVAESVDSSCKNLGVSYLDSLVLHSLYPDMKDTLAAWRAMEALVPLKVSSIGLSNIDFESLKRIYEVATVKPNAVQNRFTQDTVDKPNPKMPSDLPYPLITFDRDVREYCRQHGITYAPWGLLWGSLEVLDANELVTKAGNEVGLEKNIACYALMKSAAGCRISILCGTTNQGRMHETLAGLAKVQKYVTENEEQREIWEGYVKQLKVFIDGNETTKYSEG